MRGYRDGLGDGPTDSELQSMGQDLISSTQAQVGPDANQVATLQAGQLAAQTSASGQYVVNPSTGQLTPAVGGISLSNLLLGGLVVMVIAFLLPTGRR